MQAYNETTNEPQTAIHHKLDSGKVFAFSQKIYSNIFQAKGACTEGKPNIPTSLNACTYTTLLLSLKVGDDRKVVGWSRCSISHAFLLYHLQQNLLMLVVPQ